MYQVLYPSGEQLRESRRAYRKHVVTGMAKREDDAEPLVHLSIDTARRFMEVRLTFQEVSQLATDLWAAAVSLAAEQHLVVDTPADAGGVVVPAQRSAEPAVNGATDLRIMISDSDRMEKFPVAADHAAGNVWLRAGLTRDEQIRYLRWALDHCDFEQRTPREQVRKHLRVIPGGAA